MERKSTGLFDRDHTEIFIGDTVKGMCYDSYWTQVVRYFKGSLIPFECPDVSQFIKLKANKCKVIKVKK